MWWAWAMAVCGGAEAPVRPPVSPVPLQAEGLNYSLKPSPLPTPGFLAGRQTPPPADGRTLPPLVPAAAAPPPAPLPARPDHAEQALRDPTLDGVRECVRMLGCCPVESDRHDALIALEANRHWADYRPVYAALRKVALTERRVEMRAAALRMLAQAKGEHLLVADTLRLSALHDTDEELRGVAVGILERHARRPARDVGN
jgi:hypothetical protein